MTLREYISFWQGTYDKHQSRPTTYGFPPTVTVVGSVQPCIISWPQRGVRRGLPLPSARLCRLFLPCCVLRLPG